MRDGRGSRFSGDGRSRDNLHLITAGPLIRKRGGEDAVPHIVAHIIIQQIKSAQYPSFCRWTLGDINDGGRAQSPSMSAAMVATGSQVTLLHPVVDFPSAADGTISPGSSTPRKTNSKRNSESTYARSKLILWYIFTIVYLPTTAGISIFGEYVARIPAFARSFLRLHS